MPPDAVSVVVRVFKEFLVVATPDFTKFREQAHAGILTLGGRNVHTLGWASVRE